MSLLVNIASPYEEVFVRRNAILRFLQRFSCCLFLIIVFYGVPKSMVLL